jgi:hypothetical protein
VKGAFFITWYLDKRDRRRLQCNSRGPVEAVAGQPPSEWKIPQEQVELSRDLDTVDSQLARLADERADFDHPLYAKSLLAAAITGLDGSVLQLEEREEGKVPNVPDEDEVSIALARDRVEAMRNDLLMALEQRVKDEQLSLLAIRVIAFTTLPWLLVLVPDLSKEWLVVPFLLALAGAFANGVGLNSKGSMTNCPWLMFPGVFGVVALAVWAVFHDTARVVGWAPLENYVLFWDGAMVGVWLAVGSRLRKMQFAELLVPNADKFQIWVRLLRAGVFSLLLGLLLSFGPPTVIFGIDAQKLFMNPGLAFVFGLVFGLAELLLPQAAGAKAEGLFKTASDHGTIGKTPP